MNTKLYIAFTQIKLSYHTNSLQLLDLLQSIKTNGGIVTICLVGRPYPQPYI